MTSTALMQMSPDELHADLSDKLASILAAVEARHITCNDDALHVHEAIANAKMAARMAEDTRKKQVAPHNSTVKAINDAWREVADAAAKVEALGKRKLLAWQQAERERIAREQAEARRRQEEAQRAQEEAARKAEAAATEDQFQAAVTEAKAADLALMEARVAEPMEAPRGIRSDTGTTHTRMRWTFKVTDPKAVPREYLEVSEKAIRAAVAAGVREIPGVCVFEEETLAVRLG